MSAWPVVLLAIFVASFRQTSTDTVRAAAVDACDPAPRTDVHALEACAAAGSRTAELLTDLGDAYRAAGALDRAEAAYHRALALDGHDGDVHLRLGQLLLMRGDAAGAAREAKAALAWQPGNGDAARLLASASGER